MTALCSGWRPCLRASSWPRRQLPSAAGPASSAGKVLAPLHVKRRLRARPRSVQLAAPPAPERRGNDRAVVSQWRMGYECAYTFFCGNADAAKLRTGLGSLLLTHPTPSQAALEDGTALVFKSEWEACAAHERYALVPLSDRNIRENWFFLFEGGNNASGSPAFDYAPRWHRGTPFEWFAVAASCRTLADREHTAITLCPLFKDLAHIMSQDIVRRFYRRMAFAHGALLGLFSDDYSDVLFSADVLVARDMHGSSFDDSDPQIDEFVHRASHALVLARHW